MVKLPEERRENLIERLLESIVEIRRISRIALDFSWASLVRGIVKDLKRVSKRRRKLIHIH